MYSDWKDVTTFSDRAFQVFGPETGKARLSTVDRLTGDTKRPLMPVERTKRRVLPVHVVNLSMVQQRSQRRGNDGRRQN